MNKTRPYKLGKRSARHRIRDLHLANYLDMSRLKDAPAVFSHGGLIKAGAWGMLSNDTCGDCTIAGPMHQLMVAMACAGKPCGFTDQEAIGVYSVVGGYDPRQTDADGNNPTDNGCDMIDVANQLQKVGFLNEQGDILKIDTFARVNPHNLRLLAIAAYLFNGVQLGVQLPESAMDQTDAGKPWSVTDSAIDGGHDVYLCGRLANGNWECITWGQTQEVEPAFVVKYADEALLYLMEEDLVGGKSPEELNVAQLQADRKLLAA